MIAELVAAAVLVYSGSMDVRLTGFTDGKMHVDFGSEIDQMSDQGVRSLVVTRLCCGSSVMSSDGTIWYSNGSVLMRVRHDESHTRDLFPIPYVHTLAAGPDGSVWFKSTFDRFLGHIDANGVVQKFADPHIVYSPRYGTEQIVVANDGAAWCTSFSDRFLARVDVNGTTTIAPHYYDVIDLVTPARRGGIWISSIDHIVRYDTPDHAAETLPINYWDFVETNDGAIWYGRGNQVVQWKSGTETRISLPEAGNAYGVSEIVPESDTTVWVRATLIPPPVPAAQAGTVTAAATTPMDAVQIYRVSVPANPKRHATR